MPFPEIQTDNDEFERGFRGERGRVMLREAWRSVRPADRRRRRWKPRNVTPDLSSGMTRETLDQALDAIAMAFGCLPALFSPTTTGPLVREAQRHLARWTLSPWPNHRRRGTDKLGDTVELDLMTPMQAFDLAVIQGVREAVEAMAEQGGRVAAGGARVGIQAVGLAGASWIAAARLAGDFSAYDIRSSYAIFIRRRDGIDICWRFGLKFVTSDDALHQIEYSSVSNLGFVELEVHVISARQFDLKDSDRLFSAET